MHRDNDSTQQREKGYHKLRIVKEIKILIKLIYKIAESFPKAEQFGITSQIKRASVSILLNIVEGQRRNSDKDFLRFLNIADASLAEVEVILELALELEILKNKDYKKIEEQRKQVAYMLTGLKKKVKSRIN